jgi:hypothetical protein
VAVAFYIIAQAAANSRVAIVVPYRPAPGQSRERQLAIFSRSLRAFLQRGCRQHPQEQRERRPSDSGEPSGAGYGVPKKLGIFVIEQSADGRRFNKGMVLNAVSTTCHHHACWLTCRPARACHVCF